MEKEKRPRFQQVMTHDQVAEVLFLNPKTIQIIERKALEKVRRALKRNGYKVEDFL